MASSDSERERSEGGRDFKVAVAVLCTPVLASVLFMVQLVGFSSDSSEVKKPTEKKLSLSAAIGLVSGAEKIPVENGVTANILDGILDGERIRRIGDIFWAAEKGVPFSYFEKNNRRLSSFNLAFCRGGEITTIYYIQKDDTEGDEQKHTMGHNIGDIVVRQICE